MTKLSGNTFQKFLTSNRQILRYYSNKILSKYSGRHICDPRLLDRRHPLAGGGMSLICLPLYFDLLIIHRTENEIELIWLSLDAMLLERPCTP